ncbi:small secreted hydrophilic protein [Streptomyces sp. NPDC085946]|uniref:small secreted hydrophilic protein n=1 Tax=Streptomyces sp. NPDC085946 TaxID=3365744 RepID=UPI0037CE9156
MAAPAAVVAIPLGVAATGFALTDRPGTPRVPAEVELDGGSPAPAPTRPGPAPGDEVVSRPPATDRPAREVDDDDRGQAATGDDDWPGDDGPGDDGPGPGDG